MGNPIISENFIRLLDTRLREVSEKEWNELPSMIPQIFRSLPSDSAWEEFFSVGAVGNFSAFSGKLQYGSISPGYLNRIEPKEYAQGLVFERKFLDDKKYAVMEDAAGALGEAAQRTRETFGAEMFAYAFSSALTFQYSEEGVALCSDSHTTKSGASTSSGFDNAGSDALSATSVAAARLAMRRFKGDIGQRIVVEPDTLIVPDNLYDTALEIVGTDKGLYSGEGTKNVQQGRFKVVPYLRLDDYDTNNWFLVDSKMMKKDLLWIDRIPFETKTTVDFETFAVKFSGYFRCGCGFKGWRWIYGSAVS
jgi:hypothetical protein